MMAAVRPIYMITNFNIRFEAHREQGDEQLLVDLERIDSSDAIYEFSNDPLLRVSGENLGFSRKKRYITPKIPNTYWEEMVKIHHQNNLKTMCSVIPCQRLPLIIEYEVGPSDGIPSEESFICSLHYFVIGI